MSNDSTRKGRSRKAADRPKKPYPEFPLTPHASDTWQKKIRGKIHYFGRWAKRVNAKLVRIEGDGWKEALEEHKAQADDLHAGRAPRVKSDGLTIADLCNRFRTAKLRQREAGEITARVYDEYKSTTDRLVSTFGGSRLVDDLAADDLETLRDAMAKQWGPVRLGNEIQKVRTVFKYGYEAGLMESPVRYGPQFKKPSASVLRRHRQNVGRDVKGASPRIWKPGDCKWYHPGTRAYNRTEVTVGSPAWPNLNAANSPVARRPLCLTGGLGAMQR
jgi:hypothetical protein